MGAANSEVGTRWSLSPICSMILWLSLLLHSWMLWPAMLRCKRSCLGGAQLFDSYALGVVRGYNTTELKGFFLRKPRNGGLSSLHFSAAIDTMRYYRNVERENCVWISTSNQICCLRFSPTHFEWRSSRPGVGLSGDNKLHSRAKLSKNWKVSSFIDVPWLDSVWRLA